MNVCSLIFILLCFTRHLSYGLSNNTIQRVINGIDTSITIAPYVISFRINGRHACCASIINNNWAVTAAHCVRAVDDPFKNVTLSSGSSILYKNCTVHNVINFFVHEKYNSTISDYDIAVIQVTPAFTYNNHTKAINLPSDVLIRRKWGIVCGWGYYLKINDYVIPVASEKLQCAAVPRINNRLCQEYYANRSIITPRMTCYGYQEGGIDSCQGDSGGPVTNADDILLGITSWGDGCAQKNSPGVYTNVELFIEWIKNKTGMDAQEVYYLL